jgi:hypothetical protein
MIGKKQLKEYAKDIHYVRLYMRELNYKEDFDVVVNLFTRCGSKETGVPIVGTVYTDSLGKERTDGDTYLKMMKSNINMILEGLSQ